MENRQQQGKEAQMCLFSGNNKKGSSGCVRDASGDRTKVGNNVSDTTFVWLCPESSALHPLSPTRTHNPLPAQPLPISSSLPLYACPPQIQTPN